MTEIGAAAVRGPCPTDPHRQGGRGLTDRHCTEPRTDVRRSRRAPLPQPDRGADPIFLPCPALTGFGDAVPDHAARVRALYNPARLDARFRLFEGLTLPSLRAQSDVDFPVCVLVGRDLPYMARDRLIWVLRGMPTARIVALPPLTQTRAIRRALAGVAEPGTTHQTGFRLDDDDALAIDVVARLRRMSGALLAARDNDTPFAVGFNRGLFVMLGQGTPAYAEVVEKLPLGIGLSLTVPVGHMDHVFRRNHRLMPQFFSTFTDADHPAFLRTVHSGNDSGTFASGLHRPIPEDEAAAILAAHFPFTQRDIAAI